MNKNKRCYHIVFIIVNKCTKKYKQIQYNKNKKAINYKKAFSFLLSVIYSFYFLPKSAERSNLSCCYAVRCVFYTTMVFPKDLP